MRHGRIGLLLALTLITGGTIWLAAQAPKAPMADAEENEDDAKEKAIADRFRKVLESNPRRGTALDRLYGYHVERGTLDKLIEEYSARTKQNDKDGVAWMVIGLVEAQRGKDGAAVAAFTKAEAVLPGALPSYYLGQTQVLIGKPDEAAAAFERAIARKPQRNDLLDVYGALGRIYQRSQKPEKALEVWTRLEQQFPDDARVQEQIATSLQEEGQYEQALPRVEKLAKATDDKYRQATLRMEAADLKVKLKRTPDALTDFEKILGELNPDSWLYRDVRRRIEDVFLRNDDLAGLAKYYEKWLEKNPTDIDAIARLAKNLTSQGRGPDAQKWLQKGLESAPSNRSLRQALIDQLAYEGKFTEAAAQYEAMAKTDPGNPDILRDWGKLLARDTSKPEVERKANAATIWKKILEKKPSDPVATAQVAELMRVGGAEEEAIALYNKAIELAPNQPQYREYLGEYYHALKRSADAISTWRPIAEGENRNAKNLTRLAEVFAGFGYRKEAINAMGQAISLEKDDFNLLTSYADLLHQEGQHDEARKQIDLAAKFTSNAEEVEQILVARIKIDTSLEKLGERIDELVRDLGDTPTAEKLLVLARYYEANKQSDKAVEAINQAAAKDAKSVPVLTAAARIHEAGGNLLAAADANRKLATVDRRYRTEYLTAVMKLEQRLGRRKEALQAGKDLIASAPGNPEVYKTYSDLCFQIGELDEGLEALRRSVRANPGEPASLISLANALIDRGRSGEAIELFWRAYDKSTDLEGKLTIIDRLAAQYLEANQFDKLIERLERERGESEKVREGTLALAQAYQSAGDLGTARQQLERLLTENTRDTNLLSQLSQLCEQEGDMTSALKYQRQLSAAAPQNFDAKVRLATLLIRSGEGEEGAAVWVKFIAEANEPHRNLQAIDTLISNSRIDTAKSILSRMLATQPANWELLYREGAVLASEGKRDEAARRFQAIVALKKNDDELGEMLQYQAKMAAKKKENDDKKKNSNMPTAVPSQLVRNTQPKSSDSEPPVVRRLGQVNQIRQVTGIEERYYRYQQQSNFYAPQDYGEARMAAVGFLYEFGRANNTQDTFVKAMRDAKDRPNADLRSIWDWYYLQQLRQDSAAILPTALALAKASNDPIAAHTYLSSLPTRTVVQGRRISAAKLPVDKTPPLPAEQLDFMLATFKRLKQSQPNWVSPSILTAVTTELKRGKREQDEKTIYAELLKSADTPQKILNVMTASAEKDDYETTLAMFQRLEQLQPARDRNSRTLQRSTVQDSYWSLTPLMCKRLAAKKYDDGLSILDRYLGASRKSNINTPKTASSQPRRPTAISNQYINIYDTTNNYWTSKQITYPVPNNYYSASELTVLLNAFEQFKKADLVSDLFTHFQKQVGTVPPAEQSFVQLALAYMHWWNDEKDEALIMLEQVAAANTSDFQMTFEVASLREQNNEHGEALNLLDTINPNDHQTMQRREEIVLRLAERTGNVDRARLAAERLFGLRLDSDKQLELAGKMHRLGMHQLAETVLARAQRQAGNKTNTLVSLMNQHQTNGQVEQAVAIARQLLRKTQFASTNTRGNTDDGSNIRSQAVGVLARSGQLKELIERTEAQLKVSPKSLPIHQQLLTYYQAANDIPKQKAAIKTIIELKPEDGRLRFSMAQLQQNLGDKQAAIENYKEAIKREPMMFQNSYYEIERLFSEAGKFEELVNLIDSVDYRKLGNYWQIANLLEPLFQKDKTRDLAMKMFKKAWDAFPTERAYLMGNVRNEHIWQIPEIYDYLRQALIPKDELSSDPWQPFTNVISYEGDGRRRTIVSKMLQLARQQHRLPELRTEVTEAIKKHPTWVVGRAMLAIIDIQMGNKAEGIATWEKLFADPNLDIPAMARGTLAQELEYYSGVEKSVIRAMEASIDELLNDTQNSQEWQYTPARRLVWWYEQTGRIDDARKLLVKASRTERPNPGYSGGYWEYRQLNDGMNFGNELLRLGDSIEALRIFQNLLADPDKIAAASSYWGGSFESQVADGVKKSMKAIKPEAMPQVIETLLTPRVTNSTNKTAFDLMIGSDAREFAKLRMTSVFDTVFQTLAKTENERNAAGERIRAALEKYPNDLSVHTIAVMFAAIEPMQPNLKARVDAMARALAASPLETLPKDTKPNSRQRTEASQFISVWLAARACLKHDATRTNGEVIANYALEAAKRQSDPKMAIVILREWGQFELDRKEMANAEAKWNEMLQLSLPKPSSRKSTTSNRPGAPLSGVPVPAPVAPPVPAPLKKEPQAMIDDSRPTYFTQVAVPIAPNSAAATPAGGLTNKSGAPVLTTDQFEQAYNVAKLAAEQKLYTLSLNAIREAVRGGPPVPGKNANSRGGSSFMGRYVGSTLYYVEMQDGKQPITVQTAMSNLVRLWKKANVPPLEIYTTLAIAVFPDSRPAELFVQGGGRPLGQVYISTPSGGWTPVSDPPEELGIEKSSDDLGGQIITAAIEANMVDDLRKRIASREAQPLGEIAAKTLGFKLALTVNDEAKALDILKGLRDRVSKDTSATTTNLAATIAELALENPKLADTADAMIQTIAMNYALTNNLNSAAMIAEKLIAHHHRTGKSDKSKMLLKMFEVWAGTFTALDPVANTKLGEWYLKLGDIEAALKKYAAAADADGAAFGDRRNRANRQEPPFTNAPLFVKLMLELPAEKRYLSLLGWTRPSTGRKAVRYSVGSMPIIIPPAPFAKLEAIAPGKIISTMEMLVDAAAECGKLDELAKEVETWTKDNVDQAEPLRLFVALKQGKTKEIEPELKKYVGAALERMTGERKDDEVRSRYDYEGRQPAMFHPTEFLIAKLATDKGLGNTVEKLFPEMRNRLRQSYSMTDNSVVYRANAEFVAAQRRTPQAFANGTPIGWTDAHGHTGWFSVDGLLSLGWSTSDAMLHYDTPLGGTFEFSFDAWNGNWSQSHAGYGGLIFEPNGEGRAETRVYQYRRSESDQVYKAAPEGIQAESFNRFTIQVSPQRIACLVNGKLFWEDPRPTSVSPWLVLFSGTGRMAAFRNPMVTGKPEVLPVVNMLGTDRMDGWFSVYTTGATMPARLAKQEREVTGEKILNRDGEEIPDTKPTEIAYWWEIKDGELLGRKQENPSSKRIPSELGYIRPIKVGDSVSYEFFYEAGKTHVHPKLGRLVFLLKPDGVNYHWITTEDTDWSGVKVDNAIPVPNSKKLNLKEKEWNTATLTMTDTGVSLKLNGEVVFDGPIPNVANRYFGFFHFRDQTAVRVRNAQLTGNWPKTFDAKAFSFDGPTVSEANAKTRRVFLGDKFTSDVKEILSAVQDRSADERYSLLADWVLPGAKRSSFQFHGIVTPSDVLGVMNAPQQPEGRRVMLGSKPSLPVLELLAVAKEAKKLDDLATRVQALKPEEPEPSFEDYQQALTTLVKLAKGEDANEFLKQLGAKTKLLPIDAPLKARWPAYVAALGAMAYPRSQQAGLALIETINAHLNESFSKDKKFEGRDDWQRRCRSLLARARHLVSGETLRFGSDAKFTQWGAVAGMNSWSRSQGFDTAHWTLRDGEFTHHPGHDHDLLILKTPLTGEFVLSCDLTVGNWTEMTVRYGGYEFELNHDRKFFLIHNTISLVGRKVPINPPLATPKGTTYSFRMVIKDGLMTCYVDDRQLHQERIGKQTDPWIALHGLKDRTCSVKNLKISGKPVVPESFTLSASDNLAGWRNYLGTSWGKRGEELYHDGAKTELPEGTKEERRYFPESAMYYQRPFLEDGSVEYEFYYHADKAMVYPMLDRLVFLVNDGAAKLHWLTDGPHEKSGTKFDNELDEPKYRKEGVKLKPKSWNTAKVSVKGDTVSVHINGTLVYERPIESTNQRVFGLFHYTDRSAARVRNVVYRGDWSKTPPTNEQLLETKK